jgi:hypothetical protein
MTMHWDVTSTDIPGVAAQKDKQTESAPFGCATSYACVTTLFMRLDVANMATVQPADTWNAAVGKPLALVNDRFVPSWSTLRIVRGCQSGRAAATGHRACTPLLISAWPAPVARSSSQ